MSFRKLSIYKMSRGKMSRHLLNLQLKLN